MDNKKIDVIFTVIIILIAISVIFIAYSCVYMWTHTLSQVDSDFFKSTQQFLGVTLCGELLGGFIYKASKNFAPQNTQNADISLK